MIEFVKSSFRGLFTVVLWLNLIGLAITGMIMGHRGGLVGVIVGLIVGLIAGFMINVIGGGFIATILNIDENLEQLKKMSFRDSGSYGETRNNSVASSSAPLTPRASNVGDTWFCKKCNTVNPLTASSCKDCGHYK